MTLRLIPVCLLAIVASTSAFADDASHLAKAREYMRVTQAEANSRQTVDAILANIQTLLNQTRASNSSPDVQPIIDEFQTRSNQLIRQTIAWDAIKGDIERLTVETYTEQELDDLIAFYNTPNGRTIAAKTGTFAAKSAEVGQQRAAAMLPQIQALAQEMTNKMTDAARQRVLAPAQPAKKK